MDKGRELEIKTRIYFERRGYQVQKPPKDLGVDWVVWIDGKKYAVQCKNWEGKVGLAHLGTFLTQLDTKGFEGGYLVVREITKEVENILSSLSKKLMLIPADEVLSVELTQQQQKVLPKELRAYQQEAVQRVVEGLSSSDKGKLIMATGTGKTLVALRAIEKLSEGKDIYTVLYLCPSIALLDQTIQSFYQDREKDFSLFAVVSDQRVGELDDESYVQELKERSLLSYPPTTSSEELRSALEGKDGLRVVFSTYQSLDVVIESGLEFDLIVCDEAHRTAGVAEELSEFKKVHTMKGKKLFMTATPKVYEYEGEELKVFSMDDEELYGKTFYEYNLRRAIEEGYLCDYDLVVYVLKEEDLELEEYYAQGRGLDLDSAGKVRGLLDFVKERDLKRGIIFVNTIKSSKSIAQEYQRLKAPEDKLEIKHIEGKDSAFEKREKLRWLEAAQEPRVLTNARVLTEGVDVPALDFIAFFEPRRSQIDIVQAIGRVVRKAEGKKVGYIFIPVVVSEKDLEGDLKSSKFKHIWQTATALASIDEGFAVKVKLEGVKVEVKTGAKDKGERQRVFIEPSIDFESLREKIRQKIVQISRADTRRFIVDWTERASEFARRLSAFVQTIDQSKIEVLRQKLQSILNEEVSRQDVQSLIVQHALMRRLSQALFDRSEVDEVLDEVFQDIENFFESQIKDELEKFYHSALVKARGIEREDERQDFIRELYDNFFNRAFKEVADQMGVAYTPKELVQFILRFTDHLTRKHFNKSLQDDGVVILEPFAGTGTFLTLLLDMWDSEVIQRKLQNKEVWLNEILLLPYLSAVKNVESLIKRKTGKSASFSTALWTDSFRLMELLYEERQKDQTLFKNIPVKYKELIQSQLSAKVNVIISNPPWRAGAQKEGKEKKNMVYKNLRKRIERTYAKNAKSLGVKLVNSLYDLYVHALRMASDRIERGVIGLVLNNGWLDGLAGRGIRKALFEEFAEVYVYNLKGSVRKNKAEGESVFNNTVGSCLLFLVKKPKQGPAKIYYREVPDGLKRHQKLRLVEIDSQRVEELTWEEIQPSSKHDWINQGQEDYESFVSLEEIFSVRSLGVATNRDSFAFNFSKQELKKNMQRLIEVFNEHVKLKKENLLQELEKDMSKIKWDRSLIKYLNSPSVKEQSFDEDKVYLAYHRPFVKMWLYFDNVFNACVNQLRHLFPTKDSTNLAIAITHRGSSEFGVFMVDRIVSLDFIDKTYLYPLYVYEKNSLYSYTKRENITDAALRRFRNELKDQSVSKEDIFYYIYGLLNCEGFVENYKNDFLKNGPRVPILKSFWEIARLGRRLADVHLGWEGIGEAEVVVEGLERGGSQRVQKVRLKDGVLVINDVVRVYLPEVSYRLGRKTPIEHVVAHLTRKEDKDTKIVWEPELSVQEYVSMVRRLISLCVESERIREALGEFWG